MATVIASSNGGSIRTWSIARVVGSTPVGPNSDSSADVASGIVLRSVHRAAPLGLCIGQLLPGAWAHRHTTAAASSGGSVHTSRGPANMALSCHASHTRAAQPITRRDIDRYVPSWVLETRFVKSVALEQSSASPSARRMYSSHSICSELWREAAHKRHRSFSCAPSGTTRRVDQSRGS